MDLQKDIARLNKDLKTWYFALRNEPQAIEQLRLLILGIITCLVILYGGNSLFLEKTAVTLDEQLSQKQGLQGSIPAMGAGDSATVIQQLMLKKTDLKQQIELLTLNRDFLQEQWGLLGDAGNFAEIIFTLKPSAPVHIEENLEQMTVAETRTNDLGVLYPVTLTGTSSFAHLFDYLQYLERHGEVSVIDNLEIKIPAGKDDMTQSDVHFSLLVGRMELGDKGVEGKVAAAKVAKKD